MEFKNRVFIEPKFLQGPGGQGTLEIKDKTLTLVLDSESKKIVIKAPLSDIKHISFTHFKRLGRNILIDGRPNYPLTTLWFINEKKLWTSRRFTRLKNKEFVNFLESQGYELSMPKPLSFLKVIAAIIIFAIFGFVVMKWLNFFFTR